MPFDFSTFLERVSQSGLMTRDELEQFRQQLGPASQAEDVEILGRELIKAGRLTRYQIGHILQDRPGRLVLGQNVLLSRIGEGGMGRVYKAEHRTMKRIVALKVIHENALRSTRSRKRFMLEVQTAAQLMHPNIVTAYDADEQDGVPYLVMEFVDGLNLRQLVQENGPFDLATAVEYVSQAAEGLSYAHSKGIIHRDIKPSNLLLDKKGCIKILDMGLAQYSDPTEDSPSNNNANIEELTKDKHIIGTVEYMSPEQADDEAEVDQRSDVYALGCTLYYLVTGKPPFHRSTPIKTLVAHRIDPIPSLQTSNPDISSRADRLFKKMVAKHPDDRFQSMDQLLEALTDLAGTANFEIIEDDSGEGGTSTGDTEMFDTGELLVESASGEHAISAEPLRFHHLSEQAIGIDLGTTFSVISHLDKDGRPTTIPNLEGGKITPSVVLFDEAGVIVGKEAVKAMPTDMAMIAECAKRDLGAPAFHKKFARRKIRPEVLLAYILRKLKRDAEMHVGPIRSAVITVPAYFDETRRKATQDAGFLAGLDVLDIINEPTAAAIAFGFQQAALHEQAGGEDLSDRTQRILVYDLGGGTFDVTVMEIRGDVYCALATDGDVRLGGRDWDERLVNYVAEMFLERTGEDPRVEANSFGKLIRSCEEAKQALSLQEKTFVTVDFAGKALRFAVSRNRFEQLTQDLLARTEFTTRQTLKAAGLNWKKISRILLVGGSTRMPAVAQMLESISGLKVDRSVAADEAVAHGAAIRAGMVLCERRGQPVRARIVNVNSHSLGVVGTNAANGKKQAGVLIPRNTALPASAQRVFRTQKANQGSILVQIVEGESSNPDECSLVGKCIVHNLPKNLPERTPITISFQYDENGRLTVLVKVSGLELKQQIMRENSMTAEEMDRWRELIAGPQETEATSFS
jgi:molecular chaperone DnaK